MIASVRGRTLCGSQTGTKRHAERTIPTHLNLLNTRLLLQVLAHKGHVSVGELVNHCQNEVVAVAIHAVVAVVVLQPGVERAGVEGSACCGVGVTVSSTIA